MKIDEARRGDRVLLIGQVDVVDGTVRHVSPEGVIIDVMRAGHASSYWWGNTNGFRAPYDALLVKMDGSDTDKVVLPGDVVRIGADLNYQW